MKRFKLGGDSKPERLVIGHIPSGALLMHNTLLKRNQQHLLITRVRLFFMAFEVVFFQADSQYHHQTGKEAKRKPLKLKALVFVRHIQYSINYRQQKMLQIMFVSIEKGRSWQQAQCS